MVCFIMTTNKNQTQTTSNNRCVMDACVWNECVCAVNLERKDHAIKMPPDLLVV